MNENREPRNRGESRLWTRRQVSRMVAQVMAVGLVAVVPACQRATAIASAPIASPSVVPPVSTSTPVIAEATPTVELVASATPIPTAVPTDPPTPSPVATATLEPQPSPTPVPPTATVIPARAAVPNLGIPRKLIIPKIGLDTTIESVGIDRDGVMETPSSFFTVGWFNLGAIPGEPGNAVIDGHLDSAVYGVAVFWNLHELVPGDHIQVVSSPNKTLTFAVDQAVQYPYNDAPMQHIFGPSDEPHLNLITCSGIFNHSTRNYNRRLVVYSHLVSS